MTPRTPDSAKSELLIRELTHQDRSLGVPSTGYLEDLDSLNALPARIRARALVLRGRHLADETRRRYETTWRHFEAWCLSMRLTPLPAAPSTLIRYLIEKSEVVDPSGAYVYSPRSFTSWVAAINKIHSLSRHPEPGKHPLAKEVMEGLCRERAKKVRRVLPITLDVLQDVLKAINLNHPATGTLAHRDYAILSLGFSGAFRRSEIAGLTLHDVTLFESEGLHAYLKRSKTDQAGLGMTKAIPFGRHPETCPACAFTRWLRLCEAFRRDRHSVGSLIAAANLATHVCQEPDAATFDLPETLPVIPVMHKNGWITSKPIGGAAIAAAIKRRVEAAGYDPAEYSGHSLRAGFVTQAYRAGATTHEIMRQTGHKNPATVELYSRETDPMLHNAVTKLGL